jgi:hypothetical protein
MRNFELIENQQVKVKTTNLSMPQESELSNLKGVKVSRLYNIPEPGLAELMRKAKAVRYAKEKTIDSEINKDSLLIIFMGNVQARTNKIETTEDLTFQIHEPNGSTAELALITNELRTISTITLKNAVFSLITKSEFNNWLMDYQDIMFEFLPLPKEQLYS